MFVCNLCNYKMLIAHIWVLSSKKKKQTQKPSKPLIRCIYYVHQAWPCSFLKQKSVTFSRVYLYPYRFFRNFPSLSGSCHTPGESFPLKIHTVIKYSAFVGTGCIWKQTRHLFTLKQHLFTLKQQLHAA